MGLCTIKRSADFQRVRGGARFATVSFVIETRAREPAVGMEHAASADGPRFGFTITRKLGGAVVRNRIRRRLKHALYGLEPGLARAGHDYVVVARDGAIHQPFDELKSALGAAIARLHKPSHQRGPTRPGSKQKAARDAGPARR